MKNVAYLITWTESERGWGCRPDGASLHISREESEKYVREYWDRMPDEAPDEYSRPDGKAELVIVNDEIAKDLQEGGSIRIWQTTYSKFRKDGSIVK